MSEFLAMAMVIPMVLTAAVAGADVLQVVGAQTALHSAAELVDRSLVANGCLTQNAESAVNQTLTANHLNPNQVVLSVPNAPASYGQRGLTTKVGYDLNLNLPGTPWTIAHNYVQAVVNNDQSQSVPGNGANQSACVSSASLVTNFGGTIGGSGSGGSGSGTTTLPGTPTALTEAITPNPTEVDASTTISGQVSSNGSPVAGQSVTIADGANTVTVTTDSKGHYTGDLVFRSTGTQTVTASADSVSTSATVTVQALTPANVTVNAPQSVTVGEAFTLTGTVTSANGSPIANGTTVQITSNSGDIPSTTVTTTKGTWSDPVPNGITQLSPNPVTVTATAGSASGSAHITVNPGAPQAITLTARPQSGAAGSPWSVSGVVTGPDGTPVAAGTAVTMAIAGDSQDSLPTLYTGSNGAYSGSFPLTDAGTWSLTATAGSVTSPPVSLTVTPGAPTGVENAAAAPNPVNQGANVIVSGTAVDAYGNPEPSGIAITLTSSAWTQYVSATTSSGGAFSASVIFNAAGNQQVIASSGTTSLNGGQWSIQVNPQGAYTVQATQTHTTATAGQPQSVTWTVTNSAGSPVTGTTLTFRANPASATLSTTKATTNSAGQVTMSVTPTQTGTLVVTATMPAASNVTGTASWSVQAATPGGADPPSIYPSVAQSTSDGGTVDPVISGVAIDAYGNPMAGSTVAVAGGWDPGVTFTGTSNAQGYFSIALNPVVVGGPYHPTITISDKAGSNTQTYTNTSLTVVSHLYTISVQPTNGNESTPAGTPYGVTATLTDVGLPVPNATLTFTMQSGDSDATTRWAASGATPSPSGPTSITATTNSAGQATVEAAFMPNTGQHTVFVSYAMDNTTGTLGVSVTANQPVTATWVIPPAPDPVAAGQAFHVAAVLTDAYGFGVANGEPVAVAFAGLPQQTWDTWTSGYGSGTIGSGAFTPTQAGTFWVVIFNVNGQPYDQSGDPSLPGAQETVNPGPVQYLYPVLGPANNSGGTLLSGGSWDGTTMAYGTLPASDGQTLSLRMTAYDAYGNPIPNWTGGALACSDTGGSCGAIAMPPMPTNGGGQSGWGNEGAFAPGSVTLTLRPTGSDVSGSATISIVTFTVPYPYSVLENNGGTVENVAANPWTSQSGGPAAPPSGFAAPVHALNTWFAAKPGTNGNPNCNSTTMACTPIPGNPPTVDEWTGASWQPDVAVNAQLQSFTFQVQVVAYNTCGYHYGAYYCAEPTITDGMTAALTGNSSVLSALAIGDPNQAPGDMYGSGNSSFYALIVKGVRQTVGGGVAGPWSKSLTTPMPTVGYNGGFRDFYGIPVQDHGSATYDLQQLTYGQWGAGGTVQAAGNVVAILTASGITTQTQGISTSAAVGSTAYMPEEQLGTSSATSTGMQWTVKSMNCVYGCYSTFLVGSGGVYAQGVLLASGGGYNGSNYPSLVHIPLAYNASQNLVWLLDGKWQTLYRVELALHRVTSTSLPWAPPKGSVSGNTVTTVSQSAVALTASQVHAAVAVEVQYKSVTTYCGGWPTNVYTKYDGAWLSSGWTTQGSSNAPPIGDWLY